MNDFGVSKVGGTIAENVGYNSYVVNLAQSGTNAPVATVIANTLTVIPVWSRTGVGQYDLTATGQFPRFENVYCPILWDGNGANLPKVPIVGEAGSLVGYYFLYYVDENRLKLNVTNTTGTFVEFSSLITGIICIPEIRVYPLL